MWYITVVLLLTIFSIRDYSKGKVTPRSLFNILWLVLTFMLVFRYGQGTDYYEYQLKYESLDSSGSFLVNTLYHGEIGWYMLTLAGNKLGMSFFFFNGIISFVEMIMIRRFILLYSPYRFLSLLLFYPTFYLTGCYSVIRQGLELCLFLGIGVPLLLNKKTFKYLILIVCLSLIHTSAVALLICPFLQNWKKNKYYLIAGIILIIYGFKFIQGYFDWDSIGSYVGTNISIAGILVRVILLLLIWALYSLPHRIKGEASYNDDVFFRIYLVGFIISLFFYNSATLSQRLTMPFKAVEIVLLPILIFSNQHYMRAIRDKTNKLIVSVLFFVVVLIMNVEFTKNIYSYLEQGNYYSWVTPFDYPYSSVFDQNKIRKYISNFDGE